MQDDFQAGQLQLNIAGAAVPLGVNPDTTNLHPTATVTQPITQSPAMAVTIMSVGTTQVSGAGEASGCCDMSRVTV